MERFRVVFLGLGMSIALMPSGILAGGKDDDAKAVQGSWALVSGTYAGKKDMELDNAKLVFEGETFALHTASKVEKGRFRIDSSKKPKQLELLHSQKDKVLVRAIISIEGDTLKICWYKGSEPKAPPSEFASKADTTLELIVLRREKK
jgi:uncharacterized protein (TIGR03067 family)